MSASEKLELPPRAQAADIPSVDRLLRGEPLQALLARHGRAPVINALRAHLS